MTRKLYRAIRARISELNAFVAEHVSGMKVVQIFTAEDNTSRSSRTRARSCARPTSVSSCASPSTAPLLSAQHRLHGHPAGLRRKMVISGVISVGVIIAFQRYVTKFFDPIQELAENSSVIQSAAAAAERIFWLMDTEPQIQDDPGSRPHGSFPGAHRFKNVWFAYRDEEWVLRDVSFTVEPGQRVAFVGATGAGKTIIQNLICRYFDIQKGQILIDGWM